MTDSKKNNPLMMIFFLILLVCSVLGTIAFVMQFTDKKCPSPSPASERYQKQLSQVRGSGSFKIGQGTQRKGRAMLGPAKSSSDLVLPGSVPILKRIKRKGLGMKPKIRKSLGMKLTEESSTCIDKCMQQCTKKSQSPTSTDTIMKLKRKGLGMKPKRSTEHYGGCYKKKKKSTSEHYWGI